MPAQGEGLPAGRAQRFGVGAGVGEGDLKEGAQARERGAQLVGGVGDEVTLSLEGGLQAGEQAVEGVAELGQLVRGLTEIEAPVQVSGGDDLGGGDDGAQRAQEPAGDEPAQGQGDGDQQDQGDGGSREEPGQADHGPGSGRVAADATRPEPGAAYDRRHEFVHAAPIRPAGRVARLFPSLRAEWAGFRSARRLLLAMAASALVTVSLGLLIAGGARSTCVTSKGEGPCPAPLVGPDGTAVRDRYYFVQRTGHGAATVPPQCRHSAATVPPRCRLAVATGRSTAGAGALRRTGRGVRVRDRGGRAAPVSG